MKRILVVATRQIGDVLLTTPLIHRARQRWPEARIEVLGFQGTLGMLAGNPEVAARIEIPPRLGWRGALSLARRLWRRYDLALVTDPGDRAHLIGWLAGRRRSGILPPEGGSNGWKRRLLTHAVASGGDRGSVHAMVEKQQLLAPWAALDDVQGSRVLPPPAGTLPADVAEALAPGAVVVHAPSMWAYKQWPLEHYAELVRGLLARGHQVLLTGSASARDRECIAPLRTLAAPPALLDLSGRLDFVQLVALFQRSALYIGPDTSVTHLAAACGLPVLALFGPSNPERWAPWPGRAEAPVHFVRSAPRQQAGNVVLLQGPQACVPCGRAGCEDHRQSRSDCLQSITPQRALEAALALLARSTPPAAPGRTNT